MRVTERHAGPGDTKGRTKDSGAVPGEGPSLKDWHSMQKAEVKGLDSAVPPVDAGTPTGPARFPQLLPLVLQSPRLPCAPGPTHESQGPASGGGHGELRPHHKWLG